MAGLEIQRPQVIDLIFILIPLILAFGYYIIFAPLLGQIETQNISLFYIAIGIFSFVAWAIAFFLPQMEVKTFLPTFGSSWFQLPMVAPFLIIGLLIAGVGWAVLTTETGQSALGKIWKPGSVSSLISAPYTLIIAPLAEEVFFRGALLMIFFSVTYHLFMRIGVLNEIFAKLGAAFIAIMLVSAIMTFWHLNVYAVAPYNFYALFFSNIIVNSITLATGSILFALAWHESLNLITYLPPGLTEMIK